MKHEIEHIHQDIFNNIKQLMDQARNRVSREVNNILIQTYWEIGWIIVEDEQGNLERAEYGKKLITDLSKRLTKEYGKGFSKSNLFNFNMRNFYLTFPIFQTLSGKLSYVTFSPSRSVGAWQINHPLCGCASKVIPKNSNRDTIKVFKPII